MRVIACPPYVQPHGAEGSTKDSHRIRKRTGGILGAWTHPKRSPRTKGHDARGRGNTTGADHRTNLGGDRGRWCADQAASSIIGRLTSEASCRQPGPSRPLSRPFSVFSLLGGALGGNNDD